MQFCRSSLLAGAGGQYANEYAAAAAAALAEAAGGNVSDLSSDSDSYDSEEDDVDRKLSEIAAEFGVGDLGAGALALLGSLIGEDLCCSLERPGRKWFSRFRLRRRPLCASCRRPGFHVREERRLKAVAEERQNRPQGPSRKQIKRMRRRIWEANRNGHPAPDENKLADMERERADARRRRSPTMGYGNFR